jgi:hypothetical protein
VYSIDYYSGPAHFHNDLFCVNHLFLITYTAWGQHAFIAKTLKEVIYGKALCFTDRPEEVRWMHILPGELQDGEFRPCGQLQGKGGFCRYRGISSGKKTLFPETL